MIATLKGILKSKSMDGGIVVDVQGVGYQISVSLNSFYELPPENMEVALQIHTHINENQWSLYGFLTRPEKQIFKQLIKVSGVGPKSAMNILSGLTPHEVCQTIANGDAEALRKIPGIGQKTAERILVDLKGKILLWDVPLKGDALLKPAASQTYDEALSALTHLGYTQGQAQKSLEKLDWEKGIALEEAIRHGLKNLVRG